MDVKMENSGQKTGNLQITTFSAYYKGAILINATSVEASVASITIHNCSATGTPDAGNMVAELSTIAAVGDYRVDAPTGVIECPNGIRVVKTGDSMRYHVRYSILPG